VIVGDLNTPLSPIDRASMQKINKETSELLQTLDQIDMVGLYRVNISSNNQAIHILFCSSWNFFQVDQILGHTASLNKFKKIEITPCIILDGNEVKMDLNNKRNYRKYSNTCGQNNTLLKKSVSD
jgi:predicted acetyltransferase